MRNVFDQYQQPENRLSHALAVCLNEDRKLLGRFLTWAGIAVPAIKGIQCLKVIEQTLPGDAPELEIEAERNSLPDIVIHDKKSWCVLIESKIQAALSKDQLHRHEKTLRRRGFDHVTCVVLTKAGIKSPPGIMGRTWCGLYELLGQTSCGEWPERLREYLRIAEIRLARMEYLTEGTLTMFDGFPFSPELPYTYGEAKRLLKLAMSELRKDDSLISLGMDPDSDGRGAITGDGASYVWDYVQLKDRPAGVSHTAYPHLTMAIHVDHLEVAISIPNGVPRKLLRRLADLGSNGLRAINSLILERAKPLIERGAWVEAFALQRHYLTQSSPPTLDAIVKFKLETAQAQSFGGVKVQPEWMNLFVSLAKNKESNLHFAYSVHMPWKTHGLKTRESLGMIAQSWIAMEPLLGVLRDTQPVLSANAF